MKTKVVYIITSTETDVYLEQTYLSIYSLIKNEPHAHVVLLTDNMTDNTLTGNRAKVLELISEKIVVPFEPIITNMRRSRWLKTKMRSLVRGDILYIDGDTVINTAIHDIDECQMDIGAVEDAHRPLDVHYGKEKLFRQAKTLGFSIEGEEYYFNGGVFFVKDTNETRTFFERWHKNWLRSVEHGINQDMPALIQTNIEMGHMIQRLDGEWNCQVMYGLNYFTKAKIVHYFASRYTNNNGGYIYELMNPMYLEKLKETGQISDKINRLIREPVSCFNDQIELIGGRDVDLINTHAYKLLRLIYSNHPLLFSAIQNVLYLINKRNKGKNE